MSTSFNLKAIIRKILICARLIFCYSLSFGQIIAGQVKDSKGNGIPFTTINIKDSKITTYANASGFFKIKLDSFPKCRCQVELLVSAVGYTHEEVAVQIKDSVFASIIIDECQNCLNEVVATAVGHYNPNSVVCF